MQRALLQVAYSYYAVDQFTDEVTTGLFTYNYKGNTDVLSRLDLPNGTKVEQEYDALQRLSEVKNLSNAGANLASYAYAYDTRDVRTGVQSQFAGEPLKQVAYSYDTVDQLTGEVATGGAANAPYSNAFGYDSMGNRTQLEHLQGANTTLTTGTSNRLNQLSVLSRSSNGVTSTTALLHDAGGNLTQTTNSDGSKTLYTYDDADRLWRIEHKNAAGAFTSKSEWVYDYASRKAIRREFTFTAGAWALQSETRRVFDGLDVIQERNAANEVTAQLTRDGNIGGILARTTLAGVSYFGYDGGGNVTLLTNEVGAEVGRYSYDAFGNTLEASGARAGENPYRFSTKEYHAASGLYDFGFRFYSASSGRWVNRDPIAESGGINLYGFVSNNPVNNGDEYGESIISFAAKLGAKGISKGIVKNFIKTQIKGKVKKLGLKKFRQRFSKEADELESILNDEWWEWGLGMIPVVGDAYDVCSGAKKLKKALDKADALEEKIKKILKIQGQSAKSLVKPGLQRSDSWHDELAGKTYNQLLHMDSDKAADMKKLIEQEHRLGQIY